MTLLLVHYHTFIYIYLAAPKGPTQNYKITSENSSGEFQQAERLTTGVVFSPQFIMTRQTALTSELTSNNKSRLLVTTSNNSYNTCCRALIITICHAQQFTVRAAMRNNESNHSGLS